MNIILPIMVFLEKVVAFLKQIIIAGYFGTDQFTDSYQIAENIISILRGAFSNSLPIVFLATLVRKKTKQDGQWKTYSKESIGSGIAVSFLISIVICVIALAVNGGDKSSVTTYSLSGFILVLSPTVVLGFTSCMLSAQLEAEKIYWPAKIVSLLTSVCVITSTVLFFSILGLYAIFIGEILALVLHVIVLIFLLFKNKCLFMPTIRPGFADNKSLWRQSIPLMISSSVYSLNSLVDKAIALGITSGSATVLQYSRVLSLDLFPSIIVTAFSGILVRVFSELVAKGKEEKIGDNLKLYIGGMMGFLGVVAIVSAMNSRELISIAYQRGAFDEHSVMLTNLAFKGYLFGVFLFPIREVSARVHYAFNDTKTPFISSMIGIGINVVLSYGLSRVVGLFGISIATSISILISGIINCFILGKKRNIRAIGCKKEVIIVAIAFAVVVILNTCIGRIGISNSLVKLAVSALGSLIVFYVITWLLKSDITKFVMNLVWKSEDNEEE